VRFAVTRSLRSLRSGEFVVLRAPAEPAPSTLSLLADSRVGPPLAACAAAGDLAARAAAGDLAACAAAGDLAARAAAGDVAPA
jgi:hypothetical protein